ncbi:MAG TPA: SMC-Scp complex subunit ScpB [Chromatiaceae bacterium]|jgi:segregation and condensation protein B|nr:SMC-Scp complex subunit ScpB [Chromatiaceae bacterium]HIN83153.1 SMC-Scp complex subunit ScpB [Chromatiales bacterium]HIA07528.1 SMC-Scp complex subunit ScpB [Chromatiaceae bacterium]HIB84182.1 SMC-Scp complex subunit ScpB [Chromatiaceae bacterium]HIO13846.1 SMC-Scp complex subunit ScpB [Chromatiales bacterium]
MEDTQLKGILEAVLLTSDQPLTIDNMLAIFDEEEKPDRATVRKVLEWLQNDFTERSIELKEVGSGFRIQVKSDYSSWVSRLWDERPQRYSRALMETIALIAYRQPVTRGEIEEVRGVAVSTSIIQTLLEREWVRVVAHREVPGRPALYGTTKAFLDYFNLKSLDELPSLAAVRDLDELHRELELELAVPEQAADADSPAVQVGLADGDVAEVAAGDSGESEEFIEAPRAQDALIDAEPPNVVH